MRPRGAHALVATALPVLAVCALAPPLTGCGHEAGLESAGRVPAAVGPVRLWPDLPPATNPPIDYGETDTERVPGITVPHNDVHTVDPVAVVQAEVRAHAEERSGPDGMYEETVRAIEACGTDRARCPILTPYYRDLTGNGRDELIVGIRMPEQQVGVRVYLAENGTLTRIMSTTDQVVSVELAGRDLIMRVSSAGIPGYEYRTAWSWDEQQRSMLPARDEIVRVKPPGSGASVVPPPAFVSPSATPTPAPVPVPPEAGP
ncbi:hypothetical protein ACFY7C_23050 [Streptomyces sp. NPDC012769]|uniref:hypothetical protein n=1 Tax=Streptomyces sp. NPDC012769 TaxID=3364848 RepID=UPI0036A68D97